MTDRTSPTSGTAAESAAAPPTAVAVLLRPSDRRPIETACRRLGLELLALLRQAEPDAEPVLGRALDAVRDGRAGCLVVRRLSDLDTPSGALADVIARIEEEDLHVVVLDVGLDTTEPTGRLAVRRRERPGGRAPAPTSRSLGYTCAAASADGHAAELAEDRETIRQTCRQLGVELLEVVGDRVPRYGKALDRPGLQHVLDRLAAGEATCLVVPRMDHLSHSAAELGRLMAWLDEHRVRLVALEPRIDTGSDAGREVARALVSIGSWERERLSERTRAGLAAAEARRHLAGAGAEEETVAALRRRIRRMRDDGMTLQAIADALNAEGVPTLRGGTTWRPSSVRSVTGTGPRPA